MQQDFLVGITLFAHYGCTYLAEAYTMSPSGSGKEEPLGYAILQFTLIDYESRTEQV